MERLPLLKTFMLLNSFALVSFSLVSDSRSINLSYSPLLERASILALFYGLADLTGNTKQTITLHATAKARLTAEDIKIATDKNWDVQ